MRLTESDVLSIVANFHANQLEPDTVTLTEAQIQLNKNRDIGFGNIVILAGGAGSGKGMTVNHLLNVQGKVLDVDRLKTMALAAKGLRKKLHDQFGDAYTDPKFLKDPKNVTDLHLFVNDVLNLPDKVEAALFASILTAHPDRKPNIIFDVTLKDFAKLHNLHHIAQNLGYDVKKIHLVWVLNTIEIALAQNQKRSRTVSEKILMITHSGASLTMRDVLGSSSDIRKYVDGDIFINFNQAHVDTELEKSGRGGMWLKRANYVQVKEAGKPVNQAKVDAQLVAKIKSYVPNPEEWDLRT